MLPRSASVRPPGADRQRSTPSLADRPLSTA